MKNKVVYRMFVSIFILSLFTILSSGTVVYSDSKYPTKPVKLMVPYGPGGVTDLAARILSSTIPEYLGQPLMIVNKPGAAGSICFDFVKKAKSDGYTIMMAAIGSNLLNPAINPKLPFKYDDLTYLGRTNINPNVLAVRSDSPWKSLKDLAEALKNNPGKYKYSVVGFGGVQYLGMNTFLKELDLRSSDAVPVSYNSGVEQVLSLLQGETQVAWLNFPDARGNLDARKLHGLAVTTAERLKKYKDIPTFAELGYPGIDIVGWRGVAGPPSLPKNIVKVWDEALQKNCKNKAWLKLVDKIGDEPGCLSSEEFTNLMRRDFKKYRALFTELGVLMKK